jgi:hypothetical protein
MNNLKTYEEMGWFSKKPKFLVKPDDDVATKLLDFIVKHCDEIDLRNDAGDYRIKVFSIKQKSENPADDPLGEDDWDEESTVIVKLDSRYERLTIDDQLLDVSVDLKLKINDALDNILTLRANKIKQAKIDKMHNLLKKFD